MCRIPWTGFTRRNYYQPTIGHFLFMRGLAVRQFHIEVIFLLHPTPLATTLPPALTFTLFLCFIESTVPQRIAAYLRSFRVCSIVGSNGTVVDSSRLRESLSR